MVLWGITGSMFPILLKRIGVDPAVSSAPFTSQHWSTFTGLVIYFGFAYLLLKGSMF